MITTTVTIKRERFLDMAGMVNIAVEHLQKTQATLTNPKKPVKMIFLKGIVEQERKIYIAYDLDEWTQQEFYAFHESVNNNNLIAQALEKYA